MSPTKQATATYTARRPFSYDYQDSRGNVHYTPGDSFDPDGIPQRKLDRLVENDLLLPVGGIIQNPKPTWLERHLARQAAIDAQRQAPQPPASPPPAPLPLRSTREVNQALREANVELEDFDREYKHEMQGRVRTHGPDDPIHGLFNERYRLHARVNALYEELHRAEMREERQSRAAATPEPHFTDLSVHKLNQRIEALEAELAAKNLSASEHPITQEASK